MKILIAAPLKRRIDPSITASRSRVIFDLISGLLKKGHEISILGTGDSKVSGAEIIPITSRSFVDLPKTENPFYTETAYLIKLAKKIEEVANNFDIVHNHTYPEFINLMVLDKIKTPMVTTVHAQATRELDEVLALFPRAVLVSISNAHKNLFKKTKIAKVIYNGLDTNFYTLSSKKRDYFLWIGRLSKAKDENGNYIDPKGVRWAIKLARETGINLLLTGSVEDTDFYNKEIRPFLSQKIKWIGPVTSEQKLKKEEIVALMQGAKAFLMTINWEEPFGLVMIEAMSCGTPVIGFDRGSVSEIVIDGRTGFVIKPEKGVEGLKKALENIGQIKHEYCREHVIRNFSLENMVKQYENLYKKVLEFN